MGGQIDGYNTCPCFHSRKVLERRSFLGEGWTLKAYMVSSHTRTHASRTICFNGEQKTLMSRTMCFYDNTGSEKRKVVLQNRPLPNLVPDSPVERLLSINGRLCLFIESHCRRDL